jgi:hypothetical protein
MISSSRDNTLDIVAGSSAVLAFVSFIQLSKIYHGYFGLTVADLIPLTYLLVSWVGLGLWAFRQGIGPTTSRYWLWLSLLVGLHTHYGALVLGNFGGLLMACSVLLSSVVGYILIHRLSIRAWSGLRRVVTIIPWLIFITPLVVAQWMAPRSLTWLDQPLKSDVRNTATVVVLLDEMNANATLGLQDILRQSGLTVSYKPILPVHGSTIEVVPALFSQEDFKGARVCGIGTLCTSNAALSFDKIRVLRPDVDVVGFHHAYCDIKGLRSCIRLTTQSSLLNSYRWLCKASRFLQSEQLISYQDCQTAYHYAWVDLQESSIEAVMASTTLKAGGVLYAHLPFPHPPAAGTGSLQDQYLKNIQKTEQLLTRILDRLEANQLEPQIMIFADHPLRQSMWCDSESRQFDRPCTVNSQLHDEHVPIIVAGRGALPSIDQLDSNKEVFSVLRKWLDL